MIISLIEVVVDFLNMLPSKDRVFYTLSSSIIVEGIPKLDMGYKNIAFCAYLMVHIGTKDAIKIRCVPKNSLKASYYYGG